MSFSIDVPVAWGDMDALGHVNHTRYLRWMEDARIAWFVEAMRVEGFQAGQGVGPILARAEVDFARPVTYPDTVTVAVSVARVGTSSLVLAYEVTSHAQAAVVCRGQTVLVLFDYATQQKVAISEELRARMLG